MALVRVLMTLQTQNNLQTMKTYPIKTDTRYTITQEFSGHAEKRHVLRFCGDFIAQSISYTSMAVRAIGHKAERNGAMVITEQTA